MKKKWIAALAAASMLLAMTAMAEDTALPGVAPAAETTPTFTMTAVTEDEFAETFEEATPAEAAQEEAETTPAEAEVEDVQDEFIDDEYLDDEYLDDGFEYEEGLFDDEEEIAGLEVVTEYRRFINKSGNARDYKVSYYNNVYAYNHGDYVLTPFDSKVPERYFTIDDDGVYAVAPIVLDITDAMRTALYGEDDGETILFYGQYCERVRGKKGVWGFSGVHEGVDFRLRDGAPLYAILGGEIVRAGDSNGTVAVYNEEYDVTVLYLHCEKIKVRRGDYVEAGAQIGEEGEKGSGSAYTHVEMREGRHSTSNTYRGSILQSACPYLVMQRALGVVASGRQPITAAAVAEAERMREEAEAALLAMEQAEEEEENAEPEIELVDVLPGTESGYGFDEEQTNPVVPEATLPPSL